VLKKSGIILCILLSLVLTVMACSGDGKTVSSTSSVTTTRTNQNAVTTTKSGTALSVTVTSTPATSGASFDEEKDTTQPAELSVKTTLPADYPKSVFPVYSGSQVAEVMYSGNSYSVVAYSEAPVSDVIKFYKDVLKNASVMSETEEATHFESFGMKDGYTYTISIGETGEYKGFKTELWLTFYK